MVRAHADSVTQRPVADQPVGRADPEQDVGQPVHAVILEDLPRRPKATRPAVGKPSQRGCRPHTGRAGSRKAATGSRESATPGISPSMSFLPSVISRRVPRRGWPGFPALISSRPGGCTSRPRASASPSRSPAVDVTAIVEAARWRLARVEPPQVRDRPCARRLRRAPRDGPMAVRDALRPRSPSGRPLKRAPRRRTRISVESGCQRWS